MEDDQLLAFDHLHWVVSNVVATYDRGLSELPNSGLPTSQLHPYQQKLAQSLSIFSDFSSGATFWTARFGMAPIAFKGLETGQRDVASQVLKQGQVLFALSSPILPSTADTYTSFLGNHGPAVRDVAFTVKNCREIYQRAISNGAVSVLEPTTLTDQEGSVVVATIKAFGDIVHSFVERSNYKGVFMPGYQTVATEDPLVSITPSPGFKDLDHIVINQENGLMKPTVEWYCRVLGFVPITEYSNENVGQSAFRTTIVSNHLRTIKLTILEPLPGKKKSQNQEFLEFHGGVGIQHIAVGTEDICHSVAQLRTRGVRFQEVPPEYYSYIREKLLKANKKITESLEQLQALKILLDTSETGYLLQIFTGLVQDRPTSWIELIQRRNNDGFGEGNIKALFECVEREQMKRGNLV